MLSIYICVALWENDQAVWDSFGLTALAWFAMPAAMTGLIGPVVRKKGIPLAVTSATSRAAGFSLTYTALFLRFAAESGSSFTTRPSLLVTDCY